MANSISYNELQRQIAQAEAEKHKAEEAERIRLAVETANRQKIADADRQLARLKAQQAEAELNEALAHANDLSTANRAAVRGYEDVLAELVTTILGTMKAPQNAAQRSYQAVRDANDAALNAGLSLANFAPPAPLPGAGGQADDAAIEHERNAVRSGYGKARSSIPSPFAPDIAALEGMSRETDPERRRVWAALHHIITGVDRLAYTDSRYSAEDDARSRENARTRPRGFG